MYKVLENTYGIEKVVALENQVKEKEMELEQQRTQLKDL